MGHVGYYQRFIHKYAILASPLTNLLKKDQELVWTKDVHQDLHEPQCWLFQIGKKSFKFMWTFLTLRLVMRLVKRMINHLTTQYILQVGT